MTKQELDKIRKGISANKRLLSDISRVEWIISRRGENTERREELNRLMTIYTANKREFNTEKITEIAKNADLTESEFLIFTLYYGNALMCKEISKRYYYSERTIYNMLGTARKKLNIEE